MKAFIPTQEYVNRNGNINNKEFIYNEQSNLYVCPEGKELTFYSYEKESNAIDIEPKRKTVRSVR
jgi:hypothetical protein